MLRRCAIALLAATVLAPPLFIPLLSAQVRGIAPAPVRGVGSAPARGIVGGFLPRFEQRRFAHPAVFLGSPFFYSDYAYQPGVVPAEPQVIVVQAAPAAAVQETNKPAALLIEWDGSHYVRRDGTVAAYQTETQPAGHPQRTSSRRTAEDSQPPSAKELPSVVLIFRDGQTQEVRNYAIVNGILYAHGDYWVDGYWNREIRLSLLNVPATLAANQQRGVSFVLPSASNEVITRP